MGKSIGTAKLDVSFTCSFMAAIMLLSDLEAFRTIWEMLEHFDSTTYLFNPPKLKPYIRLTIRNSYLQTLHPQNPPRRTFLFCSAQDTEARLRDKCSIRAAFDAVIAFHHPIA